MKALEMGIFRPKRDTSAGAIRDRAGLFHPTPEEAQAFWVDNEPHMLPPDDEPQACGSGDVVSARRHKSAQHDSAIGHNSLYRARGGEEQPHAHGTSTARPVISPSRSFANTSLTASSG
jgi:hypothetical protein